MSKVHTAVTDVTKAAATWIIWYIPAVTVVALVAAWLVEEPGFSVAEVMINSSGIFMYVVGILMTPLFFSWLFRLGITRKMFYKVVLLVLVNLTVIVTVTILVLTFLLNFNPWVPMNMPDFNFTAQSVFIKYLCGLTGALTGAAFYLGTKYGMSVVLLTGVILTVGSIIERNGLSNDVILWLSIILLTFVMLILCYRTVKSISVKL